MKERRGWAGITPGASAQKGVCVCNRAREKMVGLVWPKDIKQDKPGGMR